MRLRDLVDGWHGLIRPTRPPQTYPAPAASSPRPASVPEAAAGVGSAPAPAVPPGQPTARPELDTSPLPCILPGCEELSDDVVPGWCSPQCEAADVHGADLITRVFDAHAAHIEAGYPTGGPTL